MEFILKNNTTSKIKCYKSNGLGSLVNSNQIVFITSIGYLTKLVQVTSHRFIEASKEHRQINSYDNTMKNK